MVDDLLARLDGVRRSGRGWVAPCPAHDDRHPSLSVCEGERAILLRCWAGCSVDEIMAVLGIEVRNLFYDTDQSGQRTRRPAQPRSRRYDWRATAGMFKDRALDLYLRAERVLEAARGLDPSGWSDEDLDAALSAVARAHDDLDRADVLEDAAFALRVRGLTQERSHHAS